ncbi:hypothetical protein POX_e07190 [Penicillium oxalicum]|uniref:hypothetical protein n=1 Tax=Penicillium oxalicum TaxID=69781 RepID=UPI0020B7D00A|nr:hypothetical protein POX_e07190 [Penicillium oxalicum]KAI2789162.1 hypothetical protein POX_e07190 [Penicillium oxalicum]
MKGLGTGGSVEQEQKQPTPPAAHNHATPVEKVLSRFRFSPGIPIWCMGMESQTHF